MKRITTVLLLAFLAMCPNVYGQIQEGGIPLSFSQSGLKSTQAIETMHLKKLRVNKLIREDERQAKTKPLRYAILQDVDIDLKKQGTPIQIEAGTIWRYRILAENALSINLVFKQYKLEQGAKLYMYNSNRDLVFGAFTHNNNKASKILAIRDFPGKELIIEYFEPEGIAETSEVVLGKVGQAYRYLNGQTLKSAKANGLIDINCAEGDSLQLEKHAVARMTFSGSLCSGALVNNTKNDGTPYFLTANHCLDNQLVANGLVTYFNYEKFTCGTGLGDENMTISGSTLLATYENSDFTLLELWSVPPASYQPYYAGWNAEAIETLPSASSIHHPEGSEKKVSLAFGQVLTYPYEITWDNDAVSSANSHWLVRFDKGITLGGSSGGPLFDENNRIVGQLHGGSGDVDFYGKLSKSWRPTTDIQQQLKAYLDPDGTGVKVLDGYTPSSNPIDAFPYTPFNNVCAGQEVQLLDGSLFSNATSWMWEIAPTTGFDYVGGTTESSQNPKVVFNNQQAYTISLEVSDGVNTDKQVRSSYISAQGLDVMAAPNGFVEDCYDSFEEYSFNLFGAESYTYEMGYGSEDLEIDTDKSTANQVYIRKTSSFAIDTTLDAELLVIGHHGSCKDTTVAPMKVIYQGNDNIENAYALTLGDNGMFSNFCASVQPNEPHPPIGDCGAFGFWCDCELPNSAYVENSVWFTFVGPENGIISIDCQGFDNQIAVYDAASAEDVLAGNYTLVGASDDYYEESKFYAAAIDNMNVEPGKTYYMQVDGSACGAYGEFQVYLDNKALGIFDKSRELAMDVSVYPNPASNFFSISMPESAKNVQVKLNAMDGKLLNSYLVDNITAGEAQQFAIPKNINAGLYHVQIVVGNKSQTYSLIVEK